MDDEQANLILSRMEEELEIDYEELILMDKEEFDLSVRQFFDQLADRAQIVPREPSTNTINRLFEVKEDIKDATS
jgi:hypothetical protein